MNQMKVINNNMVFKTLYIKNINKIKKKNKIML